MTLELLATIEILKQEKNTIINDIKSILIMDICDDEKCNLIDKYLKELKENKQWMKEKKN